MDMAAPSAAAPAADTGPAEQKGTAPVVQVDIDWADKAVPSAAVATAHIAVALLADIASFGTAGLPSVEAAADNTAVEAGPVAGSIAAADWHNSPVLLSRPAFS